MTYEEALKFINTRGAFNTKGSLEQISLLLEALGNPHKNLKFIHVAGTNGKGSVSKMCSEILQKSGYTVGLFVSPSVVTFCERYQVNNQMISKEKFVQVAEKVIGYVDALKWRGYEITQFEVITAIGLEYFNQLQCDIVCLEVGMGGNLDSTNIIDTPLVALITAVALDHTMFLGENIAEIAYEKAGIIKENTDVVTYPTQDEMALAMIMEKCNRTGSRLVVPNVSNIQVTDITALNTRFSYDGTKYKLGLVGQHQAYNATMVIEAMKILNNKGFNIEDSNIKSTLKSVRFNARFQVLYLDKYRQDFTKPTRKPVAEPITILDGSHNHHSFEGLSKTLSTTDLDKKTFRILVIGMLKDKDIQSSLDVILPQFNKMIAVPVDDSPRSLKPEKIAEKAKGKCQEIYVEDSVQAGIEKAYELAKDDGVIIIAGSLHLATTVLELYNKN